MKCERCGTETMATIMSMFNTQTICMTCKDREQKHPDYKHAQYMERQAVRRGERWFPGIGKPKDLV